MKKIILTDYDGCLVNWNKQFSKFMEEKGYPAVMSGLNHYDISHRHNVTDEQARNFVREFNQSEHICNLEPLADVLDHLPKLVNNGFRFVVITSLSSKNSARENRLKNMKSIFGDIFDDLICLEQGSRKYDALSKWKNTGLYWIEDHFDNAMQGHELGLNSILLNYPFNYNKDADFIKVGIETPWKEITDIILGEE